MLKRYALLIDPPLLHAAFGLGLTARHWTVQPFSYPPREISTLGVFSRNLKRKGGGRSILSVLVGVFFFVDKQFCIRGQS